MKKLKLGFVGMWRGRALAEEAARLPMVEVTAICDRDPIRLEDGRSRLAAAGVTDPALYDDFDEFLKGDFDAAVIATSAEQHALMSIRALEAGKHVLSEIPAVNTQEEAKLLADAVDAHPDLLYMAAENCCFWSFIETWKTMYEEGQIGDIFYAEAEYLHNVTDLMVDRDGKPTWRASYDAIKYLTHDLGPLLYLMNDHVVSVSGFKPGFNSIPELSTGTPNEVAIFRTAKGALIKILVSFAVRRPMIHNYCVYGSKGTLETDRVDAYTTNATLDSVPNLGNRMMRIPTGMGIPGENGTGHGGAEKRMLTAFAEAILQGKPSPIDVRLGINISLPGILAHESAEKGGIPVDIPLF